MNHSKVVSRDEWLAARKQHLKKEKEFTRLRDKLSAERRELPWVGRHLQLPRPRAEGPRRGGAAVDHGVGTAPRQIW